MYLHVESLAKSPYNKAQTKYWKSYTLLHLNPEQFIPVSSLARSLGVMDVMVVQYSHRLKFVYKCVSMPTKSLQVCSWNFCTIIQRADRTKEKSWNESTWLCTMKVPRQWINYELALMWPQFLQHYPAR